MLEKNIKDVMTARPTCPSKDYEDSVDYAADMTPAHHGFHYVT